MTKIAVLSYEAKADAMRYLRANQFLSMLRAHLGDVTRQEFKTLRGQALKGDVEGAEKGLQTIIMRGYK